MIAGILLVQAVAFAVLSGIVASNKNRDPAGWGAIGFFFGLFGFIAAIAVGEGEESTRSSRRERQSSTSQGFDPDEHEKKCPDCAEYIKLEARVCRYCGHEFSPEEVEREIGERKEKVEEEPTESSSVGSGSSSATAPKEGDGTIVALILFVVILSALTVGLLSAV